MLADVGCIQSEMKAETEIARQTLQHDRDIGPGVNVGRIHLNNNQIFGEKTQISVT